MFRVVKRRFSRLFASRIVVSGCGEPMSLGLCTRRFARSCFGRHFDEYVSRVAGALVFDILIKLIKYLEVFDKSSVSPPF